MKHKPQDVHARAHKKKTQTPTDEDVLDMCIRKGLIEKTPYGYYFKPEFFETLEIYK